MLATTLGFDVPAAAPPAHAARVQRLRSPGGIDVWFLEDHTLPILSMQFGFRGGAALDPEGKTGAARMLADLLPEGAGPLAGGTFRRALGDAAIRLSFGIRGDNLHGELKTLVRNTDRAFGLLGLALREACLAPADVARIRDALLSEVRASLGQPDAVALRAFRARAFASHPYGRPATGDLASLERIGRDDIAALRSRMLTRGNLRIGVAGAIGPEALCTALDSAFADLPTDEAAPTAVTVLDGLGERLVTRLDLPQSTIRFGRPGIPRHDPDFVAATVVNHCLGGGGFASRLFREVREKRGLCYSVWTALQAADGACTLVGATSTRNDRAPEALAVIQDAFLGLADEGIGAQELETAKGYLIGSYGLRFDSSAAIAGLLLDLQLDGRPLGWLDERNRRIAAVTEADTARAIRRLVGDGELLVAIVGDPAGP